MSSEARKKKYDRVEETQSDQLNSPKNGFMSPLDAFRQQDKLTQIISKRISKLHVRQKIRVIKNIMHNLYGRHNPINYRPEFNFQERWENTIKETTFEQKYSLLKTDNYFYITLHFVLSLFYGFAAWFFSVYRVFMIDQGFFILASMVMIATISDTIIKQILLIQTFSGNSDAKPALTFKDYLKYHWFSMLSFVYIIVIGAEESILGHTKSRYFFLVDLIFTWKTYHRFKELYSAIKFKSLTSNYRNQIQILQLFGGCILLVHIFGLILFLVSRTNPQTNWSLGITNFQLNWESKYIYSVYFACTTALTVGYGDITPKNLFEILTIMCVQILGIINIGFIVNEIGRVLSKINENEQVLYNNISQAQKIIKNYCLPEHLATKMRTYVINNQISHNQLHVEEQDNLINKFKDQMRQKIVAHNHIRIVKSSVFFLCNWSKKFQINIANKLIRCIYAPQDTITQVQGKEKIFLIMKGKFQIQAFISSNPNHIKKTLNVVEFNPKKEVQFNVYGYSSCISGLKINIRAIAKDHSICYHVKKEDILNLIAESQSDFQYFHEIKVRIQQSRYKEVWQAPNIANTRQHYLPNPYYIMKKDRLELKQANKRKQWVRKLTKTKCYIESFIQTSQNDNDSDKQHEFSIKFGQTSLVSKFKPFKNNILTEKERQKKYATIKNNQNAQFIITRKNRNRPPKILQIDSKQLERLQLVKIINNFQFSKNFKTYFTKYNFSTIVKKYNKKYQLKQGQSMLAKSDTRLADLLSQDLLHKILSLKMLGTPSQTNITL